MTLRKKPFEYIVETGENGRTSTVSFFLNVFYYSQNLNFSITLILSSANIFNLDWCTICRLVKSLPFTPLILVLTDQQQTAFGNIVGKEEMAHDEPFLVFPQCFLLKQLIASPFISLFAAKLEEPKIGI